MKKSLKKLKFDILKNKIKEIVFYTDIINVVGMKYRCVDIQTPIFVHKVS